MLRITVREGVWANVADLLLSVDLTRVEGIHIGLASVLKTRSDCVVRILFSINHRKHV
jgi:hypothetical protein